MRLRTVLERVKIANDNLNKYWKSKTEPFGPVAPVFEALFPGTDFCSTLVTSDWTPWGEWGKGRGCPRFPSACFVFGPFYSVLLRLGAPTRLALLGRAAREILWRGSIVCTCCPVGLVKLLEERHVSKWLLCLKQSR